MAQLCFPIVALAVAVPWLRHVIPNVNPTSAAVGTTCVGIVTLRSDKSAPWSEDSDRRSLFRTRGVSETAQRREVLYAWHLRFMKFFVEGYFHIAFIPNVAHGPFGPIFMF